MRALSIPAIDSHVHIYTPGCLDFCRTYREANNLEALNIACINLREDYSQDATQNILALIFKLADSRIYAQAGLVHPAFPVPDAIPGEWDYALQAKEFHDLGFDGIKMLEGKPTTRKLTALPVSSPLLDGFYSFLESEGIPILSHVGDPETFWDPDRAPAFCHTHGWFYGDGSFVAKEQLYDEVDAMLSRHPGLKVTFAHFFFLSDFPERADAFLEKHPNVCFDLTPGTEMYENFTRHHSDYSAFFRKWDGRLLLGTDNTAFESASNTSDTLNTIRRFLATDESFTSWDLHIRGLALPEYSVMRICRGNFLSRLGPTPRPVSKALLARYIERHISGIRDEASSKFIQDFAEKNL